MAAETAIMKVVVDVERCLCAGNCLAVAPEVFDQDDDSGRVILVDQPPPEELRAAVEHAALMCPGMAISVVDDEATSDPGRRSGRS